MERSELNAPVSRDGSWELQRRLAGCAADATFASKVRIPASVS
jgi:hypothetical protein